MRVEVICTGFGGTDGCSWPVFGPGVAMTDILVRLDDAFAPTTPNITGGSLLSGGWKRGNQTLEYQATDKGGGVAGASVSTGGGPTVARHAAPCAGPGTDGGAVVWHRLRPCPPSGGGQMLVALGGVADGLHDLQVRTTDPAGQVSAPASVPVQVDNTPPAPPASASIDGGGGWRRANDFTVRWENPIERFAPIVATGWKVCPVAGGSCKSGRVATGDVAALKGLSVPTDGEHDLSLWLEDAAGNQDAQRPRSIRLRLDTEAPVPAFEEHDPADPQRISVLVSDAHSGVTAGEIEMREAGGSTWHELETKVEGQRLVAYVDDERFRLGDYEFRARAVDAAGNEATTDRRAGGARMKLTLPLRVETRLTAGARKVTRRNGRRPKVRLLHSVRAPFGSKARIGGTLTDLDGNPIDGATVSVLSRPRQSTGDFAVIGLVRTDEKGRFRYVAKARSSRILRFRYPGSRRIVGSNRDVTLKVPATSTIRASRRRLVVGDSVTFSGRLRTRPAPVGGKLVEIQSYFRNSWRTFSTVRSDAAGRWRFSYQFSGTVGTVRYPFRVWLPFESGYPFDSGASPRLTVLVRGL